MKKYFLVLILLPLLFSSCLSKKKFVYLQGNQNKSESSSNYEPIIQKDDRLYIRVSTLELDASLPFNLDNNNNSSTPSNNISTGYLVDGKGDIDFPVIGTLPVAGFTVSQLKTILKEKLSLYLKDPVINIRILNFKITVLGDVRDPGVKTFGSNRVTLFDALGAASDITYFGKRQNVLIVRDFQGVKTFNRVDITQANFVNSPFYYLDQNDIVYIETRKAKIDSTAIPNFPIIVSVVSFLVTMTILLTK